MRTGSTRGSLKANSLRWVFRSMRSLAKELQKTTSKIISGSNDLLSVPFNEVVSGGLSGA